MGRSRGRRSCGRSCGLALLPLPARAGGGVAAARGIIVSHETPKSVQLFVGENYNHFELPETLGNLYGPIGPGCPRPDGLESGSLAMTRIALWSDMVN
jgi:hypothetical protein